MKNKLMIIGLTIILMLTSSITVLANTETTVTLQVDKTEVKAGETFTVTLKATCPDGINGVDTTYSYETEKLELVSANIANSNFASLGVDNQITVISNATESIQSADIYTLTLKVKEGVEVGSTAKISVAETLLDSDAATDSEHTIPAQEVTVTIIEEPEPTPPPAEDEGGEQPTPPPAKDEGGEEQTPPPAEDEGGEQTPPPTEGEGGEQTPPPSTEGNKEEEKDNTIANKEYDKAGINTTLVLAVVISAILAIIIYRKNKNYKDII